QPLQAPGVGIVALDAVHGQPHAQDFQWRELVIQRRRFGYIGHAAPRFGLAGIGAVERHLALIVVDDVQHDLDGGGLARPVGADEAEHLAFVQAEAHITYCLDRFALAPVGMADALEFYGCAQGCSSSPAIFSFFSSMLPPRNSLPRRNGSVGNSSRRRRSTNCWGSLSGPCSLSYWRCASRSWIMACRRMTRLSSISFSLGSTLLSRC